MGAVGWEKDARGGERAAHAEGEGSWERRGKKNWEKERGAHGKREGCAELRDGRKGFSRRRERGRILRKGRCCGAARCRRSHGCQQLHSGDWDANFASLWFCTRHSQKHVLIS